ncbi:hypothetical protein T05_8341 [Trichinella murrelli]|uniref:MULE transposase domain-containing protein n=1 Tax=Trichinella murrelli TaxID=144512 RepID=A0A0V0UBU1_9BILA|nr:hypothetical protein T05_8341 [Trichinella murrelli]
MEKRNTIKRRAREETKPVPQIYNEECSTASTSLETAGQLPTFKSVKSARYRSRAKRFPPLPATRQQLEIPAHCRVTKSGRQFLMYNNVNNSVLIFCTEENLRELAGQSVWCMDGTFKIVPEWYQQLFTIHVFKEAKLISLVYSLTVRKDVICYCEIFDTLIVKAAALGVVLQPQTIICDFGTAFIPEVQGSFPGVLVQDCYFHFCQVVLRKVADLELRTRYLHEAEIKKIIKMLLATALLLLDEVPDAVDLHGRDVTGSVAALFEYFREECMTCNRMPLWNVYHVETSTNNHLEVWHFKMNRQAGRRHLSFYELLRLLIDEQGSTETLIQQVISGCVTVNDLRVKNKYEEVQLRITALTAEYDGGTHAIEQFLKAIAYDVPELVNF